MVILANVIPARVTAITNPPEPIVALVANPVNEQIAYENTQKQKSIELTEKAEKLKGSFQGQCVVAVRSFLGVGRDQIQGLAKNTKVNSTLAEVGSIIVIRSGWTGHVGVVLFTDQDGYVWYFDSNGNWTQRASIRKIKLSDPRIKGYRIIETINI